MQAWVFENGDTHFSDQKSGEMISQLPSALPAMKRPRKKWVVTSVKSMATVEASEASRVVLSE